MLVRDDVIGMVYWEKQEAYAVAQGVIFPPASPINCPLLRYFPVCWHSTHVIIIICSFSFLPLCTMSFLRMRTLSHLCTHQTQPHAWERSSLLEMLNKYWVDREHDHVRGKMFVTVVGRVAYPQKIC